MRKGGAVIVLVKEDIIFSGLTEEKQQEIREEALAILREENPLFENPRLEFMKSCLVEQKIRQVVWEKLRKGELRYGGRKECSGSEHGGDMGRGEKRTPGGDTGVENRGCVSEK